MRLKLNQMRNLNERIQELEFENERLQDCYDNIRAFRHDFSNIIQAIGGYIEEKDIKGLKNMYKSLVKECQEINDTVGINKDAINNPAVYNLINSKYKLAHDLNIKMKVEIFVDLKNLKIDDLNLCRILGVLIDNAIEATKECEEKIINIKFKFDKLNNRNLIMIKNSYNKNKVNMKKIFDKGYSTKLDKLNHGLGLWNVKNIIKKNKNLMLYTYSDEMFLQQLEIYN